jgi:glycosyltransferase involved in cell wall biosynthesis
VIIKVAESGYQVVRGSGNGYRWRVLKLLLIAPTCDGDDVGEAWVGYQWARLLAERHEVTLLTYHKRGSRPASQQLPDARVVEWIEPPGLGRAERFNSMLKPGYVPFYFRARRWIRQALARGDRFDLAHQPVPVAMRYPCPAAEFGIPFVMGPVGGSLKSPPAFAAQEDTAPWYVGLRRVDGLRIRHDRALRGTYEQASCVLGIAPYVEDFLSGTALKRFEVMSETGIDQVAAPVDRSGRDGEAIRLLFVGRLVRTKGARDAIRALGLMREFPVVLDIVGDGSDQAACEALTVELGLTDRVRFHGRLAREQVVGFYRAADIFVFPSYREPGGNVVFEAMAHGLPLIVSDVGGPGNVVDESCGIRLHPVSPDQYARDLAAAVTRLAMDSGLRHTLGEGARRRVTEVALWDSKVSRLDAVYADVLASRSRSAP